jgi:chemotaxis signal transduction protein
MTPLEPQDPVSEAARKLLLARAERLRQKPAEEEEEAFWTAEFPLGGQAYALPLECLVACQSLKLVTSVPLSNPNLAGIVRFQRRILGVVSLAGLLGSGGWSRDPSVLLVLKLGEDRLLAVDCEEIPRSASLPLAAVQEARAAGESNGIVKVQRPGKGPLHLIEVSSLFSLHPGRSGDGL